LTVVKNRKKMNKQDKIIVLVAILIIVIIIGFGFMKSIINNITDSNENVSSTSTSKYGDFAKCLTEKGAVMYGAESCSHCKEQKNTFGDSFKFIKYVECPDNPKLCLDNGIIGYPTWIIGTSTNMIEGFDKNTTMKELSEATSCILPQ
jgi:hypothetical protein